MKAKFDCLFYYVSDLDRSIRFYTEVLGLRLLSRAPVARFDIDGVLFELVPTEERVKLEGSGNARLCLEVPDIEQAVSDLALKGVLTSHVTKVDNGALASFEDPDGNEMVIWQYL